MRTFFIRRPTLAAIICILPVLAVESHASPATPAIHSPLPLKSGDPFIGDWNVVFNPSGEDANQPGVKKFEDKVTFTADQISAKTLTARGFGPGDLKEDTRVMGPATFTATQTSDKEGKIDWNGMVDATQLSGTITWTKKDGTVVHYDFLGNK